MESHPHPMKSKDLMENNKEVGRARFLVHFWTNNFESIQ
jgi:hypothetical protein